jgi:hypothetical protein
LRPAITPDRRAGDDAETSGSESTELGDDLLRQTPAEILLCGVSVQVLEREDGGQRGILRRPKDQPAGGEQNQTNGNKDESAEPQGTGPRRVGRTLRDRRFRQNRAVFDVDVGEKPISTSNHGLNESRLVGAVPQGQTYLANSGIKALVEILKAAVAPESGCDHLPLHEFRAALDQQNQQVERNLLQSHLPSSARQLLKFGSQAELIELIIPDRHRLQQTFKRSIIQPLTPSDNLQIVSIAVIRDTSESDRVPALPLKGVRRQVTGRRDLHERTIEVCEGRRGWAAQYGCCWPRAFELIRDSSQAL